MELLVRIRSALRRQPAGDHPAPLTVGTIRVEHHLQQALAVAQVNENNPAMVAATIDPATQGDFLIE